MIFSSLHPSGEKLNNLSGIAAILRFPLNMEYLDEEEKSENEEINEKDDMKEEENLKKILLEKNFSANNNELIKNYENEDDGF